MYRVWGYVLEPDRVMIEETVLELAVDLRVRGIVLAQPPVACARAAYRIRWCNGGASDLGHVAEVLDLTMGLELGKRFDWCGRFCTN